LEVDQKPPTVNTESQSEKNKVVVVSSIKKVIRQLADDFL
jgi:hypothetical protein